MNGAGNARFGERLAQGTLAILPEARGSEDGTQMTPLESTQRGHKIKRIRFKIDLESTQKQPRIDPGPVGNPWGSPQGHPTRGPPWAPPRGSARECLGLTMPRLRDLRAPDSETCPGPREARATEPQTQRIAQTQRRQSPRHRALIARTHPCAASYDKAHRQA